MAGFFLRRTSSPETGRCWTTPTVMPLATYNESILQQQVLKYKYIASLSAIRADLHSLTCYPILHEASSHARPTSQANVKGASNPTAAQCCLHVESLDTSTSDLPAASCAYTPTNRRSSVVCKFSSPVQRTRRERLQGRRSNHYHLPSKSSKRQNPTPDNSPIKPPLATLQAPCLDLLTAQYNLMKAGNGGSASKPTPISPQTTSFLSRSRIRKVAAS